MNNIFNPDNELAVLSILINSPAKIFELTSIKPYMFSSNANTQIYSTMKSISEKGLVAELNLVHDTLVSEGISEKCGGKEYLTYLKSLVYDANNLKEFERLVVDAYRTRSLVELSSKVSGSINNGEKVNDVLQYLRTVIDKLGDATSGEETTSLADIVDSSMPVIHSRIGSGQLPGIATGYKSIDIVTGGINPGDVWVFGGRPSQGKSAIACNMALNMALLGKPILFFSLEMSKQILIERILAIKSGVPITNIKLGMISKADLEKIKAAADEIKRLPIYIDSNFYADMDYVVGTCKKYKRQRDIAVVVLDYVQLMAERTDNMVHEIGRICRGFKLLSNDLGIGSILLSQLNRAVELRDDKRPVLSDLRQSGDLEQDADLVGMIYRDEYYNKETTKLKGIMEFIIRKHRTGPLGDAFLKFVDDTNLIYEG